MPWTPLEANPEVLTRYTEAIGLDLGPFEFCDVYGLDEEMLSMVNGPVHALILVFPVTDLTEAASKAQDEAMQAPDPCPFFLKQTIGNACGTIALLHLAGNSQGTLDIRAGSFLDLFLKGTAEMTPDARGKYLESPPAGSLSIEELHKTAAAQGDSADPGDEESNLHFVTMMLSNGRLMMFDGRRKYPVDCGPSSPDTLLKDAAKEVQRFVELTQQISFSLIALATV
jgi:ubiquitin carboxyl-terminal hydrolase L3